MTPAAPLLPVALHRVGDPLLDLQLWMLGQDRLHPAGNALARYGFARARHPTGHGSSSYLLPMPGETGVALVAWGYALYLGAVTGVPLDAPSAPARESPPPINPVAASPAPTADGLLLERHAFGPRLLRAPLSLPLPGKQALGERHHPRSEADQHAARHRLLQVAAALAGYERWAVATLGEGHRRRALAALPRHKRRRMAATPSLAPAWETLGASLDGGV